LKIYVFEFVSLSLTKTQFFVGFLNDYPEDSTQGLSLSELEEALFEVYEIRQEENELITTLAAT
jgi:hypothetical protein